MNETKRARLVERGANCSGGTYEFWDVGNDCGVCVDFNPCPGGMGKPETMAFPVDLESNTVTDWSGLGTWHEDATGGFECSECKCKVELITEVCNEYGEPFSMPLMPSLCPNCGARVVDE